MKPLIITVAVIVFGGLGYIGYTKLDKDTSLVTVDINPQVTSPVNQEHSGKKIAFSELVKQGGSYECTVKQYMSDMENDGVVFMDNNRLYAEFSTIAEGIKIDSKIIIRDGYTYTWSPAIPKSGFKIKTEKPSTQAEQSTSGTYSWNAEQIGDYYCKQWTADEAKFTLPVGMTFVEVKN